MSVYCELYGYIAAPGKFTSNNIDAVRLINKSALESLPVEDSFPYLSRGMFATSEGKQSRADYEMTHFAASIKNLGPEDIGDWLAKFEKLLRTMCWYEAKVHFVVEIYGEFQYHWKIDAESLGKVQLAEPEPVVGWTLSKLPSDA